MFSEAIDRSRKAGRPIAPGSTTWIDLYRKIVPPYDHTKFPNKRRKMEPDKPARTLLAHLGKDGYSHIHYDSSQARTISVLWTGSGNRQWPSRPLSTACQSTDG